MKDLTFFKVLLLITMRLFTFMLCGFFLLSTLSINISAQTETMAWGNIIGYRVEGELVDFETSIQIAKQGWRDFEATAKEKQSPNFTRDGNIITITSELGNISLKEIITEEKSGAFTVDVQATSDSSTKMEGTFFCMELPESDYEGAEIDLINASEKRSYEMPSDWAEIRSWMRTRYNPVKASGALIKTEDRTIEISTSDSTDIVLLAGNPFWGNPNTVIYFAITLGDSDKGQVGSKSFKIKVDAKVNKDLINITLDTENPGKEFDGIGGNFRLQNPFKDPQVIDYCLENLNVTWGRVEMPWANWHNLEHVNPIEAARNGNLSSRVRQAFEIAQKLSRLDIPIIVSAWGAPDWAIIGERSFGSREDGLRGNPLNQSKMKSISKSIVSYILFLKEEYGVEAKMFSFNESDLGINVRQTGEEHAELIKTLGAEFASHGLSTKMLLGDNSDANTYSFTIPAIEDPETHKYIGAVSFHSWRGCDDWTLSIWNDIATQINVPLIVGEGSTDASAHRYPDIFLEPSYALNEIDIYLRILSICQAKSILQWQLTSDYSVLTGDGIYGTSGSLKPTQRFWQLKQLGLTPQGSFKIPVKLKGSKVSCAAFADIKNGKYSIHLVNNGSSRTVKLSGLPEDVKSMNMFVTNSQKEMENAKKIKVENGTAEFNLEAAGYSTLINLD